MSAKHTPGPLYVGNDSDEDGFSYYYVGPENEQAARVYYDDSDEASGDQALADAMLYAAAPDLLEACVQAAIQFRFYEQQHLAKGTPDGDAKALRNHEMAKICETAIAKATGAPQ